jgi:YVTN family beta-propeller protein
LILGLVVVLFGAWAALASPASAASGWIAYVANENDGSVTPIDTATNTAGSAITVGSGTSFPFGIAITPDGKTAYVADDGSSSVTPITTATSTAGTAIPVGLDPQKVAVSPDGKTAYVTDYGGSVVPINVATNTAGSAIPSAGTGLWGIAITPDGTTAYVADSSDGTVIPINTATNTAGTAIHAGAGPTELAIIPDGKTVYVTNTGSTTVTPIQTATNTAGTAIPIGGHPSGVAITPDGKTAYVADSSDGTVIPIDTATNTAGTAIHVGAGPRELAITPDGKTAYVTNSGDGTVTPINTATNMAGPPITVGSDPEAIAITPDQAPTAGFSLQPAPAGQASRADGSSSSSPVGAVARYQWDFGDGQSATAATPLATHVYAHPGSYTARLTVTNSAGTSTAQVFTGQTVSNQGGPQATITHTVTVSAATGPTLSELRISPHKSVLAGRKVNGRCVKPTVKNNSDPRCRRPIRLKISYRLSVTDEVTFTLKRQAAGLSVNSRCVKPTTKDRKRKKCTRLVTVPGKIMKTGKAGSNQFTFNGKFGGHTLDPGTYQLIATPTGGRPTKAAFKVVP